MSGRPGVNNRRNLTRDEAKQQYQTKRIRKLAQDEQDQFALLDGNNTNPNLSARRDQVAAIVDSLKKAEDRETEQRAGYTLANSSHNIDGWIDTRRQEELATNKSKLWDDHHVGLVNANSNWEQTQISAGLAERAQKLQASERSVFEDFVSRASDRMFGTREALQAEERQQQLKDSSQRGNDEAPPGLTPFEKIQWQRKNLPAFRRRDELLRVVGENQVVIVEGETGSGKTTQIMQYLYEAGYCDEGKMVACTQPRRVAAMSVAARVAEEKGVILGEEVGYNVRFDNMTSEKTKIKYLTDGMILREFFDDPLLERYSVIMIDEAHERTVSTDILLGILKPILERRNDLKIIIASATINIEKFATFFNNAPTFKIPGRTCNIDIYYTRQPEADYIEAAIMTTMQIHTTQTLDGDILVFLPGQEEIETMQDYLEQKYIQMSENDNIPELIICPIYANLPSDEQARIFMTTPSSARKVVLATNIAETSLTINGIVYVIDSGWCKTKLCNIKGQTMMESLSTTPVSKASANQRAGRAGRIRDGKCFRLYSQQTYDDLSEQNIPEIQRCNLCNVILLLKTIGINNFTTFDWIDPPSVQALAQSISLLYALGAISNDGSLSTLGYHMSLLPLDPMVAKMLLKSAEYSCSRDIIYIAAILGCGGSIFFSPTRRAKESIQLQAKTAHKRFFHPSGDHLTLLNVFREFQEQSQQDTDDMKLTNGQRQFVQMGWCRDNFLHYKMLLRSLDIVRQLEKMCSSVKIDLRLQDVIQNKRHDEAQKQGTIALEAYFKDYETKLRLSIAHGFFPNIARFSSGRTYTLLRQISQEVQIHPTSSLYRPSERELNDERQKRRLKQQQSGLLVTAGTVNNEQDKNIPMPSYLLFHELMLTSQAYLRGCLVIEREWIGTIAPHFYPEEANYNASNGRK